MGAEPSTGLTFGPLTRVSPTTVTVDLQVGVTAAVGLHLIGVEGAEFLAYGNFEVTQGGSQDPTYVFTPNIVRRGESMSLAVVGSFTKFVSSGWFMNPYVSGASSGHLGLTFSNLDITDDFHATVEVPASSTATLGMWDTRFTSYRPPFMWPTYAYGPLFVDDAPATNEPSAILLPGSMRAGTRKSFMVLGTNTAFQHTSDVSVLEGSGVTVYDVDRVSETSLDLELEASANDTLGAVPVTIAAGGSSQVVATVDITAGATMQAEPSQVEAGEQNVDIWFLGENTEFVQGSTTIAVESGRGVSLASEELTSSSLIRARIDVESSAVLGAVTFTISTPRDGWTESVAVTVDIVADDDTDTDTETETDTETNSDTDEETDTFCHELTITPEIIETGTFGAHLKLVGNDALWLQGETTVSFVSEPDQIAIDKKKLGDEWVDACTVTKPWEIDCQISVGAFATVGGVEVEVIGGGQVRCGTFYVVERDPELVSIPSAGLPEVTSHTGELDCPNGHCRDLYKIRPQAGDVVVLHAVSNNRENLDPVLRLVGNDGMTVVAQRDDETKNGLDSRLVYSFAESKDYYVQVSTRMHYQYGAYSFYIYRLSHGIEPIEVAGLSSVSIDQVPALVCGRIDESGSVAGFELDSSIGPVVLDVIARRYGPWTTVFADTRVSVFDGSNNKLGDNDTWYEAPTTADPRVFLDDSTSDLTVKVEIDEEEAVESKDEKTGLFFINIRSQVVINEVDSRTIAVDPFIELLGPALHDFGDYELCIYKDSETPVVCDVLTGLVGDSAGYLAVHYELESGVNPLAGSTVVELRRVISETETELTDAASSPFLNFFSLLRLTAAIFLE